jgi:hypothetical protein
MRVIGLDVSRTVTEVAYLELYVLRPSSCVAARTGVDVAMIGGQFRNSLMTGAPD